MKSLPKLLFVFLILCGNKTYSQDISTGRVATYDFTGNANDQTGTNHGLIHGATLTTDRFNNPNQAFFYDGVNDYIEIPHSSLLNFSYSDEFTISLWINPATLQNSSGTGNEIISKWDAFNSSGYPFAMRYLNHTHNTNKFKISIHRYDSENCGPGAASTSLCELSPDEWHHLVFVKKNNRIYLYVDGILSSETSDMSPNICTPQNNFPVLIGSRDNTNYYFKGKIDDLIFYNRALTDTDIETLFNTNGWTTLPSPPTDILSFTVQNQIEQAEINTADKTITVTVPCYTDLTSLAPNFTLSSNSIARVNGVQQTSGVSRSNFTQAVIYVIESTVSCASSSWFVTIIRDHEYNENVTNFLSFSITGQLAPALIDNNAKTIQVTVPCYTNLTNLAPVFTLPPGSIARINGMIQTSGSTRNNFSQTILYSVENAGFCTQQLWSVNVILHSNQDETITHFLGFSSKEQLQNPVININDRSISLEVNCKANLKALVVNFTLPKGTIAEISSINQVSGVTVNDFSSPVEYTLLNAENCVSAPWTVYVTSITYSLENINPNDHDFFIPNLITPNKDSKNDFFVVGSFFQGSKLQIYNRYGKHVYTNLSYRNQFDGTGLSSGTYYITLEKECLPELIKGFLHIRK